MTVDCALVALNESSGSKAYLSQEPASPLGCTEQYQFCSTAYQGGNACRSLSSLRDAIAGAAPFFDTNYDDFTANIAKIDIAAHSSYFFYTGFYMDEIFVESVLKLLGPTSLLSQKHLYICHQYSLEANQWQQDVAHWWDIVMSSRQASFLDRATGPADPGSLGLWVNYATPDQIKLCSNQVLHDHADDRSSFRPEENIVDERRKIIRLVKDNVLAPTFTPIAAAVPKTVDQNFSYYRTYRTFGHVYSDTNTNLHYSANSLMYLGVKETKQFSSSPLALVAI
ncbi:hypothetical protein FHL15_007100 [Xylaria flabelliformis]|uniref:Uncharacterized protein n=1 Tax=Xylaria flabelliformis TaxID=2512241 RepID=A0A553HVM3_9PEZI|nr:hypothetical protein FHL15_007100 [Xylaria flabelliformis]